MKSLKNLLMIAVLILLALVMIFAGIDYRLYLTYVVFAIGLVALFGFTIYGTVTAQKKNVATMLGAAVLAGMIIIFYFISPTNDVAVEMFEKTKTGMGWSAIIGAGLYSIYALIGLFVALMAFFGVRNLIK
jgi:hypothetical protein